MTDEMVKKIISFVLKRIGTKTASESEMYLTLSMKLQWCPPNIAQQFIKRCIQDGVLVRNDEVLAPSFDIESVSIPLGFKPTSDFFQGYAPKQSSLKVNDPSDLFNSIISKTVFSPEDVTSSVQAIMNEKLITEDVALLFFAKKHDIDISPFIDIVEKEVFTRNKE